MSKEVKRYDCTGGGARFCQGCYTMSECEFGEYVSWDDYEALLAERGALLASLKNARQWIDDCGAQAGAQCMLDELDAAIDAALQGEQP